MRELGLASGPIERVVADVAVVPLFASERPLRDAAGRVDWRLCGRLSHLFAAARLDGVAGEAVLIPGGGGVRAPHVLGLGLGVREELDGVRWSKWIADALLRAGTLAVRHAVIALPESGASLHARLDSLAACADREPGPEIVTLAPEPGDLDAAGEWLRAAARRGRPTGVEIRPPTPSVSPQGGSSAAQPAWSSREPARRFTR